MSSTRKPDVAWYKKRSTSSIPPRPGPVQCIRNCTNCIMRTNTETKTGISEDLISIMSFDNLVTRRSLWFFQYQSLQYHVGQIDLLKKSLERGAPMTIYILATTDTKDLKFLNMIFDHVKILMPHQISCRTSSSDLESILRANKSVVIPIQMRSCVSDKISLISAKSEPCVGARKLKDLLESCINLILTDKDFDLNIVSITITKDHDRLTLLGLGSICAQISEPYRLSAYLSRLDTTQKSTHLVQHVYYDAARSAALLPSHLAAFLILHLEREDGVELTELVQYIEWIRKISIDVQMYIGFTGSSLQAANIGLMILKDFIQLSSGKYYRAKDIESLMNYAELVTPIIAYHGLISRAILIEYNRDKTIENQLTKFVNNVRIRVLRDKVLETGKLMAEKLELRIPCRRPCTTIERCVEDTICQLESFGRYIKIEEPAIKFDRGRRWAGDSDDEEEEYFRRNADNPAFKTWILVSGRDYRRDRLNLFINAIEFYLV